MPLEFLVPTKVSRGLDLSESERQILAALADGPCSLIELTERVDAGHWIMLRTKRLEDAYVLQRCGLTPTDILHLEDRMDLWDKQSAEKFAGIVRKRMKFERDEFSAHIFGKITDRLITELMKKQLELDEHSDSCPACSAVLENILSGGNGRFHLSAQFFHPLVGLGAPVGFFTEEIPQKVQVEIVIPENADVANAVGAITSFITVTKRLNIVPTAEGTFSIQGLPENPDFADFEQANKRASEALLEEITGLARSAGTSETEAEIQNEDRITKTADGSELFLERVLTAKITGPPDLA